MAVEEELKSLAEFLLGPHSKKFTFIAIPESNSAISPKLLSSKPPVTPKNFNGLL